jgi:glycosyltransferase involved in cell wall biosynthesis
MTAVRPLVLLSSLAASGAERVAVSLLCRLAQRGHPAVLCTLTARVDDAQLAAELREAGVVRHDLGARRLAEPRACAAYLRLLVGGGFDVVHAHGQDAWILAGLVRRVRPVPLALTRHVLEEPAATWRQSLRRRCALAAARCGDALVAPSSSTADQLAQLTGLCASRIHVIPNGVDIDRFERPGTAAARSDIRRKLGLAESEQMVLLPAVLRAGKGHDVLLDALPLIEKECPRARVVFAGGGEREGELRERTRGSNVLILGHRTDIPELLAGCDVVALPSLSESLPTALIEAAAARRPVVATRVGGTPDIVEHGVSGLLVTPGDPRALASAIVAVLADPAKAHAFGEAGRIVARCRFSLDAHVDRTLELWSRLATDGGQPAS